MSGTVREALTWYARQVGTLEKPVGSNHTPYAALAGQVDRQPWCATFVVAGWKVNHIPIPPGADTAWTPAMRVAFDHAGRLHETPAPGDVAFVYYASLGRIGHVGVVERVDGDYVVTVEGNTNLDGSRTGIGVYRHRRRWRNGGTLRGFGRPAYPGVPGPRPAPGYTPPAFPPGLRPGIHAPVVADLQRTLLAAGYGPIPGAVTTFYGPKTQAAVIRFHNAHPQFRSAGRDHDPAIGPRGWAYLHRLAHGGH